MLQPLRDVRVWRFGLYYFLVFGGFVALAQWLVPYYVNVYAMSIVTAGLMTSIFSLPSGVIRALGGWFSDLFGPRRVLYWVLATIGDLLLPADLPEDGHRVTRARGDGRRPGHRHPGLTEDRDPRRKPGLLRLIAQPEAR